MPETPTPNFDVLGFREEVSKIGKNPLRALFFPINIGWNAVRPIFNMGKEEVTKVPGKIFELFTRAGINTVRYVTRLGVNAVLCAPILPSPSGKGLGSIHDAQSNIGIPNLHQNARSDSSAGEKS